MTCVCGICGQPLGENPGDICRECAPVREASANRIGRAKPSSLVRTLLLAATFAKYGARGRREVDGAKLRAASSAAGARSR